MSIYDTSTVRICANTQIVIRLDMYTHNELVPESVMFHCMRPLKTPCSPARPLDKVRHAKAPERAGQAQAQGHGVSGDASARTSVFCSVFVVQYWTKRSLSESWPPRLSPQEENLITVLSSTLPH